MSGISRKGGLMNVVKRSGLVAVVASVAVWGVTGLSAHGGADPSTALSDEVTAPARQLSRAFAAVAQHVRPAVVSVYSERVLRFIGSDLSGPFGNEFLEQLFGQGGSRSAAPREYRIPQRGMGSGMILDKKGHILTNYHVVGDVDEIKVQLADRRTFEAELVGQDPRSDVAVIRIKGQVPENLPSVELGDSDALLTGELVMAIGAPFGLAQTVTTGIISAKGRDHMGIADYEDFLQTDAAINPGNSGGPLVNMRGEVVGMNTAIASSIGQHSGVSFAIPSNIIKSGLPVLIKGGTVQRGLLGIGIQDVTRELAKQFHRDEMKGALVGSVNKDSPAEKAGIKVGDIVLRYDGKPIADASQLHRLVAISQPGTKVDIVVMRKGKQQTVTAVVGKMEAGGEQARADVGEKALVRFGLTLQPLTPEMATKAGYEGQEGVLVSGVEPGSVAAISGLEVGDLIVAVDHLTVASLHDVEKVLRQAEDQNSVLLLLNRKGAGLFVVLQTE